MERANEVLALRQVDCGLAADRAVDLRDERRRYMDQGNAAEPGRGKEACGVTERAAAEGDQRLAPLHSEMEQFPGGILDDRQPLGVLAGRQQDVGGFPARGVQHEIDAAGRHVGSTEAAKRRECLLRRDARP